MVWREDGILIYNIKQDYWRTFALNMGGGKNIITSWLDVNDQVWVASTNGISILNKNDKKYVNYALIKYFRDIYVYDLVHAMNFVYIATESGLFIYDLKNKKSMIQNCLDTKLKISCFQCDIMVIRRLQRIKIIFM